MMGNNFELPGSGGLLRHGNEEELRSRTWEQQTGFDYTDGEDYRREFSVEVPNKDLDAILGPHIEYLAPWEIDTDCEYVEDVEIPEELK